MPLATGLAAADPRGLDARGVVALLDVMDVVAALHPGFAAEAAALESLKEAEREAFLDAARERNTASRELAAAIERLLATDTYRIYFRRFTNVTPELMAALVVDLPYRRQPAPGDIGGMLWDLVRRRREVRGQLEHLLTELDMARVQKTALRWVPDGPHTVPTMHLIWDSNAGSFAAEGEPFLNLFSAGILGGLSAGEEALAEAERLMAHELHHVLAEPYLGSQQDDALPWPQRWIGRLTRSFVGEGLANHCNPPSGFKRELYEDPEVVAALLQSLEQLFARLRSGSMSEAQMRDWLRDSYFTRAEALLRRHLERRFDGDELDAMMRERMPVRPDIEHTLGWWMVSRISDRGARRDGVLGLLERPFTVYRLYNQAIAGESPGLMLSDSALADLESTVQGRSSGSSAPTGGPPAATVPFEVSTGRPMVQLTVDGKGPYPFVLDTGAPGLIVRQALVDELGLEVSGTTRVTSPLGGTPVETQQVRVASIRLGGAAVTDLEAIVLDLGGAALGMGVVGPAVFREHGPLQLDFKSNTLTLGDEAKPLGVETWLPFGASAPLLDVPIQIGELRIDGHIDTGSPGTLAVPNRFADRLPLSGPVRTVGMARTVDAEFEIRAAPIETSVRIGDAEIPLREITLAELPVANLGTAGLRGLRLHVDWEHERFAVTGTAEPPTGQPSPLAVPAGAGPRFGLRARPLVDGAIQVVGTDPGSPAEAIGLLAGDRIVAINGEPTGGLGVLQVRAELAKPGLELAVERDGETITLPRKPDK